MTTESHETTSEKSLDSTSTPTDARSHQGSLRSKLVLSLAAVFFLFLTIDELVRQKVIQPEFHALEEAGAIRDANRVLAALNSEVDHLIVLARHWGSQIRDSEAFSSETNGGSAINGGSTSEINEGSESGRSPEHLDWAATISDSGTWNWIAFDGKATPDEEHDHDFQSLLNLCRQAGKETSSGMTRIGSQSLVLFALLDMNPDAGESMDPSRYLFVARKVDEELIMSLRRQTQVEFTLQSPRTSNNDQKLVIWEANPSTLVVEVQLVGLDDKKLANVYIEVPRDITARTQHTTQLARNSFIFGSVAALLILLFLLQKIVISPLTAIRQHSDRVAEHGLDTQPLVLNVNDEIGELATAFDKMVRRLSDTQTELTQTSRAAGRSQVASTVIHNVGNVLTNVNSLIDATYERTQRLRISPLNKLAERLRAGDQDGAMLEATPDYLEGLAGSLHSDQQSINELLATLNDNVRHIHDVIRAQGRHTEQKLNLTSVPLAEVIGEAIACCRARLDEDAVEVSVTGQDDMMIRCDRSLMLQTMINLIGNSRHAVRGMDTSDRRLAIDVQSKPHTVQIEFRDNGCGMSPDTIDRVFDAHFTTRESGTGLGLHFCAITLKRLGGSIRAASEGINQGSAFTLEIPRLPTSERESEHTTAVGSSS